MPKLKVGGTLEADSLYIERVCDEQLMMALSAGHYCYVLAPRAIGKSSLLVHTANKLQLAGFDCAIIDLNSIISSGDTQDRFYNSLISELRSELGIRAPENHYDDRISAVHRLRQFITQELVGAPNRRIVVFLDEIDGLARSSSLSADGLIALLRALHNERATKASLRRISFCLCGTLDPAELISDVWRTPFNIGTAIEITDFSETEMLAFRSALGSLEPLAVPLLSAAHCATSGHPFMTQRLLAYMAKKTPPAVERLNCFVEQAIDDLYFGGKIDEAEASLGKIGKFFERQQHDQHVADMLGLYSRLLSGEQVSTVGVERTVVALRMTGLVRAQRDESGPYLSIRNSIIARRFSHAWVRERRLERQIGEPMLRWLENGRQDEYLLQAPLLGEALDWAANCTDLSADELEFLFRSEARARARRESRISALEVKVAEQARELSNSQKGPSKKTTYAWGALLFFVLVGMGRLAVYGKLPIGVAALCSISTRPMHHTAARRMSMAGRGAV